jgi:hypothetical protein
VSSQSIVGRPTELHVLTTLVEGLADRRPADPVVCLIEGEAGIGKSVLWAAAAGDARRLGHRVLSCRSGQPDAGLSFAGLLDLFDAVPDDVFDALATPQRSALDAALLRGPVAAGPGADQRAVCHAVLTVVRILATDAPVVLAVDDLHWLDPASLDVLTYLLRRSVAGNGWSTPWDGQHHFAYVSTDGQVIVASGAAQTNTWSWTSASSQAGLSPSAVKPSGSLLAYSYTWDLSSHIIFGYETPTSTGVELHIYELWKTQTDATWHVAQLVAAGGYTGDAFALVGGYQYNGGQEFYYRLGNLTQQVDFIPSTGWQLTGSPRSTDDWTAGAAPGYLAYWDYHGIILNSTKYQGGSSDGDLHVVTTNGRVAVFATDFYAGLPESLTEMVPPPGTVAPPGEPTWITTDPVTASGAAPITGHIGPNSIIGYANNSEHVFYANTDGSVHEIVRSSTGTWYAWADTNPNTVQGDNVVAFSGPNDLSSSSYSEFYAYSAYTNGDLMIAGLTSS